MGHVDHDVMEEYSSRTRNAGQQGQPGRTAASSSPYRPGSRPGQPHPPLSAGSSTEPDFDASAYNAKPSTPSAQRTTAPKTHPPQPSSADVAVSVAVKDQDAPFSANRQRGILSRSSTAPTGDLAFTQELQDSFRST